MSMHMKVSGLRAIERALAELPRGTAKGVARRSIKKELAPIASMANAFWPGSRDDVFQVTSRVSRGSRKPRVNRSEVFQLVGADYGSGGAPHAHLVEFGTGPRRQKTTGRSTGIMPAQPMLRPAWDMHRRGLLPGLGKRMWDEIAKTVARRAKRAAK